MKIYFKKNNEQSAFSLIEVLVALVILSFGIIGSAKLLEESTAGYQIAEQQTEAMLFTCAIVDSISIDREGKTIDKLRYDWQNKLDQVFPGSYLTIEHQQLEESCVYTIILIFALPTLKPFTVKVAV